MNPPYDNGFYQKFVIKCFDFVADQLIWVAPLSWLLGKKQNKKITSQIDKYHSDIETINGNDYFDAAIGGTMGIVFVNMDNQNPNITFDGVQYTSCDQITTYSNDSLLMEFKSIIEPLYTKDNLDKHCKLSEKILPSDGANRYLELNPNPNWWCVGIVMMHAPLKSDGSHGDSWNAMISKNKLKDYIGTYKDLMKKTRIDKNGKQTKLIKLYFAFNNKQESYNFLKYIQTFFVSNCLSLIKTSASFSKGELTHIPWFDFSDPIFNGSPEEIDLALFKKYNISQQIIDHIITTLPNYYNLDLTKYNQI